MNLGLPPSQDGAGIKPSASLRRASAYGDQVRPQRPAPASNGGPLGLQDYRMDAGPSNPIPRARPSNGPPARETRQKTGPPQARSAGSNMAQSKVGGMLLQKRQSVSYAQAEASGMLPPAIVPNLPLMSYQDAGQRQQMAPKRLGAGGLDLDELNREGFDAEAYLRNHFARNKASASNTDVLKTLKANLQGSLDITEQDLQKSVLAFVLPDVLSRSPAHTCAEIIPASSACLKSLARWRTRCWN